MNRENIILPKDDNFCIQRPSGLGGAEGDGYFTGSEDCLYLDIKAPYKSNENLPVMFWIHGGGNTSGLKDLYDFSKMVKRHDVIVITINYRLGPFGWFTHPAIQDFQDGIDKTSNFGTLDIISALEWVQSNIKLFGGDPNNVTIFGESAGGHNVLSLLVSKYAKGLFHKSIVQSGYTTSISPEEALRSQVNCWRRSALHFVERSAQSPKERISESKVINPKTEPMTPNKNPSARTIIAKFFGRIPMARMTPNSLVRSSTDINIVFNIPIATIIKMMRLMDSLLISSTLIIFTMSGNASGQGKISRSESVIIDFIN